MYTNYHQTRPVPRNKTKTDRQQGKRHLRSWSCIKTSEKVYTSDLQYSSVLGVSICLRSIERMIDDGDN
ncbi:hypothetical protein NC652_012289 [Populus alba x Populus x berolinensis]|uniref:Uncharacterized protein n=1 Tax=Populus alba x Populus x berolinensis TaxID=444605 RepID=A0AAD6R5Y4_9ROSI|nr:hypothetical protein NC652_012289 [Populus alba x Populus x berolinensis]KAJ7002277.1 hypothetical protein NC653_012357 [Populus alba x Populus x berolinensis]